MILLHKPRPPRTTLLPYTTLFRSRYAARMSETAAQRTERADFQATTDPGLMESADRGEVNLLSYEQLYDLWERQQWATQRSEEHTSELQSLAYLVCRLLLEKKK